MLKKSALLLSVLSMLLLASCGDNPAKITQDELYFKVNVSSVVDLNGQPAVEPSALLDLCLWSDTTDERIPCVTWSSYEKMAAAKVPLKSIDASADKLELTATCDGKAYKGFLPMPDLINFEPGQTLTFELTQVGQTQNSENNENNANEGGDDVIIPPAKCQLDISVSVASQNDLNLVYTKSNYKIDFSIPDLDQEETESLVWLVDSKEMDSATNTFTFYPRRIDGEIYTITVLKKDSTPLSSTVFVKFELPVDFKVLSKDFYNLVNSINETKAVYYIQFDDMNPDFAEIAKTLDDFSSYNFCLDFSKCLELTGFPNSLKERTNICGLRFPDTNMEFKNSCFYKLTGLEFIIFGDGDNNLSGAVGDYNKSLRYVSFGDGCNIVGPVSLPDNVLEYLSFGDGTVRFYSTFSSSSSSDEIKNDLTVIKGKGDLIIEDVSLSKNLKKIYSEGGNTKIGSAQTKSVEEIYLGDGDVDIFAGAFYYNDKIKKIVMGDGNLYVGIHGGAGCSFENSSIEEFVFGNGNKEFCQGAFYRSKLKSIDLKDGNVSTMTPSFGECSDLVSFRMGDGDYTEKSGNVFYGNPNLETVTFGNGKHLFSGGNDFYNCPKLKSFKAGDGELVFGSSTFNNNPSLETVEIGKGDVRIGDSTFICCNNLKTIYAVDGILSIGRNAFIDCESLEEIRINKNCTEISDNAFIRCNNISFTVDSGNTAFSTSDDGKCLMNYEKTKIIFWNTEGDVVLPQGVIANIGSAFAGNSKITSITISDNCDSISTADVSNLTSLQSLNLASLDNWYYTTNYSDAEKKQNGSPLDKNGEELLDMLLNTYEKGYNATVYLYKREASND